MTKYLSIYCFLLLINLPFFEGIAKSSKEGIKIESDGLSVEDAYLSLHGERFNSNQLEFQTKVNLNLDGVSGYGIKDGKVFIGCSMQVFDKNGTIMLNEADLFAGEHGLERDLASNLYLTLVVGNPMQLGESYTWKVKVWDKVGKGKVKTELNFKVVETKDRVGIDLNSKHLKARSIFITNHNGAIQNNQVSYSEKLKLNFYDLKGFGRKDGKVFVGGSMVVSDINGNTVLEYSDLFSNYSQTGVNPSDAEKLHLSLVIGDPLKRGETYIWNSRVWDKTGKGEIATEVRIEVLR